MLGTVHSLPALQKDLRPGSVEQKDAGKVVFGEYLKNVLQDTDRLQKEADGAALDLISGDLENLHDLMIITEKAQLSLQLTVQVVNKVIQAYQDIYRMQI